MAQTLIPGPTIAKGTSLSPPINCAPQGNVSVLAIAMPPDDWTPASLTFQWSIDGTKFYDLFNQDGSELSFNVTPGAIVALNRELQIIYLRLRSGPRSRPVIQEADRVFSILVG